ncbi:MAG: acetyl-CoA carboxylase biotin carboxyl carrier protein [Alphaproteobacteria bacterium]
MELTEDEVLEILKMVEDSSFDYFQVEIGELKLTVAKGGYVPASAEQAPATAATPAPAAATAPAAAAAEPEPASEESSDVPEGLVTITAPMVGTFYIAPDPESPPFVEVGGRVDEDTTVALIEVMKVFSAVRSGVSGVIEQVLIPNAGSIQYGQALFLVRPDEPAAG